MPKNSTTQSELDGMWPVIRPLVVNTLIYWLASYLVFVVTALDVTTVPKTRAVIREWKRRVKDVQILEVKSFTTFEYDLTAESVRSQPTCTLNHGVHLEDPSRHVILQTSEDV